MVKQVKDGNSVIVKECCSNVRTTQKKNLNFLVILQERVDPTEYIKIFQLKKEKKQRSVKAFNTDYGGINKDVSVEDNKEGYLRFTYKKYGQRHYLITIDALESGEYLLRLIQVNLAILIYLVLIEISGGTNKNYQKNITKKL